MRLNANASVPGIPASGGDILTKPLRPVGKAQLAGPIVVDTSGRPPGASRRFRDYVPSPGRRKEILKARGLIKEEEEKDEQIHTRHVVRHIGHDYLTGKESKKMRSKQDSAIFAAAKELWGAQANERKRYKQAKKIVAAASGEDLENPSPKLKRAVAILDGAAPITKKQALRDARAKMFRS